MATINLYDITRSLFNRNSISKIYYNGLMVWPDRRKYIEGNYYTMLYSVNLADKRTSSNRSFYLYTYNDNSEYGLVKSSWNDDITEFTVTYEPSEFCEATGETTKTYTFEEVITDSVGTVRFDFTDRRDLIAASTHSVSLTVNNIKVWTAPWADTINGIDSGNALPYIKYIGSWNSAYSEYSRSIEIDPEYVLLPCSSEGVLIHGAYKDDISIINMDSGLKFKAKHRSEVFNDTQVIKVSLRSDSASVLIKELPAINVMDTLDGYIINDEYGTFKLEWRYAYQFLYITPISTKDGYRKTTEFECMFFDHRNDITEFVIDYWLRIEG